MGTSVPATIFCLLNVAPDLIVIFTSCAEVSGMFILSTALISSPAAGFVTSTTVSEISTNERAVLTVIVSPSFTAGDADEAYNTTF